MKTWHIWLFLSTLAASGLALAQETTPPAAIAAPQPALPGENIVVHLQGTYLGIPIDARYVQDTFMAKPPGGATRLNRIWGEKDGHPQIFTLSTMVKLTESGYQAQFEIGARIPQLSTSSPNGGQGGAGATPTFSYRAVSARTTVLLKPGQSVVIFENDGTLTATLEKLSGSPATAGFPAWGSDGKLEGNLKAAVKITDANGTVSNFSGILSGASMKLSTVSSMVETPDKKQSNPVMLNLNLQLQRELDGLGVNVDLEKRIPISSPATGNNKTVNITYMNEALSCDIAVKKLNEPITVYSNGKEAVILTLSRADQ